MRNAVRTVVVALVLVGVATGSDAYGAPAALPGAALGWPLLFHFERASALLATIGLVLLIGRERYAASSRSDSETWSTPSERLQRGRMSPLRPSIGASS
jgi:hypothetical protein